MKRKPNKKMTPNSMIHKCWDSAHPATKRKKDWAYNKSQRRTVTVSRLAQYQQAAFDELQKPAPKRQEIPQ